MGKKSLIKSTTKKKKESGTTAPKTPKKTAKTSTAKPRAQKAAAKKPPASAAKNVEDSRGLLFRRFPWLEFPVAQLPQPATVPITAPPFISNDDPAEAQRMHELLLNRRHTMEEIAAVAEEPPTPLVEEPVPSAPPAAPADPREVLFRKFPSPVLPVVTFARPSIAHITAPPFISTDDPAEAQRMHELLLNRRHAMEEIAAVAEEPPPPLFEEPVPAAPPAAPADPREVLFRKFPSPVLPVVTFARPSVAHITAPPFISTDDPAEALRLHELLLNRRHTMEEIAAVAEEPPTPLVEEPIPSATAATPAEAPAEPAGEITEPEPTPATATEPIPPTESEPDTAPVYTVAPAVTKQPADPMMQYVRYAALGFALLIAILIGASYSNSTTCYLDVNNGRTELWKGRFSPTGKALVTTLKDFALPDPAVTQYKLKELYPVIFSFYLGQADEMATAAVTPDFQAIQTSLTNAAAFAIDNDARSVVGLRLNRLSRMVLMYQADVAISTGSEESLTAATHYLGKALEITTDQAQVDMIQSKMEYIETLAAALKAENVAPNPEE